jgi:S-adenosylmethionine decarboxylase
MAKYKPWGYSVSINLFGCKLKLISDPKQIKAYISSLIPKIHMVAHGPCQIDRFGKGKLKGYSAMQFIETSSITVHCDEPGKRAFIDIFSCQKFNTDAAVAFSQDYFQAKSVTFTPLVR